MTNVIISQFKDVLKFYYDKEMKLQAEKNDAMRRYSAEYAKKEVGRIQEESNRNYLYYQNMIVDIFSDVRALLATANYPDPSQIPDFLKELFSASSPIRVTPAEVQTILAQYHGNLAVQRMVSDWLSMKREAGQREAQKTNSPYVDEFSDCKPVSPMDQLMVYKRFADSAMSMLNEIHYSPQTVSQFAVDSYADENFASDLYGIVGDGRSLKQYKSAPYYETAKSSYDSVVLNI